MKRTVFLILLIAVLFSNAALSIGSYDFQDAIDDAETVKAYFNGSGSQTDAATAYDRLYDFWYKDAKDYVLNKNKGKFHNPDCKSVTNQMKESNKVFITCSRRLLITLGYEPCGNCHP